MKKFAFLLISLFFVGEAPAQIYSRLAYQVAAPLGKMSRNIGRGAHGVLVELGLHLKNTPISFGWHGGIASYGYTSTKGLNVFAQGAQSNVMVETSHYYMQSQLFVQYELRRKGIFRPYLTAGVGGTYFHTAMAIGAETSTPDCPKPAETSFPLKDKTGHYMVGGGIKLELATWLRMPAGKSFCFDFQLQHTRGGEVTYMTTRQSATASPAVAPVYTKFASQAQPEVIHQYHAGDQYTSPVRLLAFQIGFSYTGLWVRED